MSSRVVAIRCADGRVRTISPGQKVTLGRTSKNDLRILDKANSISRNHAEITWDPLDEGPSVVDKGSSNGTIVNGIWIKEPVMLKNGDQIVLGQAQPILIEFRGDLQEKLSPTVALNSSSAVIIKPDTEDKVTDRWNRNEIANETATQMGWLRSRAALVDALRSIEEERKSGIVTLGDDEDRKSINLLRGRVVAARIKDLVGRDALNQLLDVQGGIVYRFVEQKSVPRGGLNVLPGDLDED